MVHRLNIQKDEIKELIKKVVSERYSPQHIQGSFSTSSSSSSSSSSISSLDRFVEAKIQQFAQRQQQHADKYSKDRKDHKDRKAQPPVGEITTGVKILNVGSGGGKINVLTPPSETGEKSMLKKTGGGRMFLPKKTPPPPPEYTSDKG